MADKKNKKKKIKKPGRKNLKPVAKKISRKIKPKPSKKKKITTKKHVAKKVSQKTTSKPSKKRKIAPQKPVAQKVSRKIKPKPGKKRKITTRPLISKKPISKKSEEERKATLRKALIGRREEIVKEAKTEISKYIKGEKKQLVDTALDDGDWAIVDLSEDISLKQLSIHRETLLKIDEALRKLDEGTYGKCEDCGEEISEERLNILPFAIYCRDCQEKREQLEVIERKEVLG